MIHIDCFSLRVGDFRLQSIMLEIMENEIFAILGKTGSGKTVLLESIAGFYRGDSGAIRIRGKNVMDTAPESRKIGFVYQDFALFPHMTVYDNIRYGLKMHKVDKAQADASVRDMARLLCIDHILKQYPETLSGGERQRTALARALVLNPKVLLMDEPFSALDPATRNQMYALVEEIYNAFPCTIVFVTHDFHEAQRMAARIGIMINGEMRTVCSAAELFRHCGDREVTEFLGGNSHDN